MVVHVVTQPFRVRWRLGALAQLKGLTVCGVLCCGAIQGGRYQSPNSNAVAARPTADRTGMHLLVLAASLRAPPPRACNTAPLFDEELNLIIDGKCAICAWEKDNLLSLGASGKIAFTDLEDSAGYDATDMRNGGVTYADGMSRITAVTRSGEILQGMQVFQRCYATVVRHARRTNCQRHDCADRRVSHEVTDGLRSLRIVLAGPGVDVCAS